MSRPRNERRSARPVVRRIVIEGNLVLQTAAHFGNGDTEPFSHTDMLLLRDPLDSNRALLPGASIAGALRSYLREREFGYWKPEKPDSLTTALFGMTKRSNEGEQSPLIVYDALSDETITEPEFRDGVKIDPKTRTAEEGAKFDLETLPAGTTFALRFELAILQDADQAGLLSSLALVLTALQRCKGEIHLGARKYRGLGRVWVEGWRVYDFDLTTPDGLLGWLTVEQPEIDPTTEPQTDDDIHRLLAVEAATVDERTFFQMKVDFSLAGSLLIRSGFGLDPNEPDLTHLHARQTNDEWRPIIPGSSLAGVIRHRALRIANTICQDKAGGKQLTDGMFGFEEAGRLRASRVRVRDTTVERANSLVQSRIKIDRFTGGAHTSALFSEQPIFGDSDTRLTLDLTLLDPTEAEIGLLLLVLKDLWTGDLSVGGESNIGRGRLQGQSAMLTYQKPDGKTEWLITQAEDKLKLPDNHKALETYVTALHKYQEAAHAQEN